MSVSQVIGMLDSIMIDSLDDAVKWVLVDEGRLVGVALSFLSILSLFWCIRYLLRASKRVK